MKKTLLKKIGNREVMLEGQIDNIKDNIDNKQFGECIQKANSVLDVSFSFKNWSEILTFFQEK